MIPSLPGKRNGGAREGLRLLIRDVSDLRSELRAFLAAVESRRDLPPRALAEGVHGASREAASVVLRFANFVSAVTVFGLLCDRASRMYERELVGAGDRRMLH